jgi:hypothetical protein
MNSLPLLSMPGPIESGILIITAIVVIYSVAKAVMRYIDNHRNKQ